MPHSKAFDELLKSTRKTYLNQKVPRRYQSRYGKIYDPKDVKSVAYAIAGKLKIKEHR